MNASWGSTTATISFQYRQRYQEGYNSFEKAVLSRIFIVFQYRQRYQEGYNSWMYRLQPMKLLKFQYRQRYQEGYNRAEGLFRP